jgi:hypothetical protein
MAKKTGSSVAVGATFEEVKTFLLKATPKQRRDIATLLQLEGSAEEGQQAAASNNVGLLYDEASTYIATVTGGPLPPRSVGLKTWGPEVTQACAAIDAFLSPKHTGKDVLTRSERLVCYTRIVQWVHGGMRCDEIPITPKTLFQQLRNVAYWVDRAFPGYAQSGLLLRVFTARVSSL